jgi:hypothetical protein
VAILDKKPEHPRPHHVPAASALIHPSIRAKPCLPTERTLRPIACCRKNWLFVGSVRGGEATIIVLSFIESAKLQSQSLRLSARCAGSPAVQQRADLDSLLPPLWQPVSLLIFTVVIVRCYRWDDYRVTEPSRCSAKLYHRGPAHSGVDDHVFVYPRIGSSERLSGK